MLSVDRNFSIMERLDNFLCDDAFSKIVQLLGHERNFTFFDPVPTVLPTGHILRRAIPPPTNPYHLIHIAGNG